MLSRSVTSLQVAQDVLPIELDSTVKSYAEPGPLGPFSLSLLVVCKASRMVFSSFDWASIFAAAGKSDEKYIGEHPRANELALKVSEALCSRAET